MVDQGRFSEQFLLKLVTCLTILIVATDIVSLLGSNQIQVIAKPIAKVDGSKFSYDVPSGEGSILLDQSPSFKSELGLRSLFETEAKASQLLNSRARAAKGQFVNIHFQITL